MKLDTKCPERMKLDTKCPQPSLYNLIIRLTVFLCFLKYFKNPMGHYHSGQSLKPQNQCSVSNIELYKKTS